ILLTGYAPVGEQIVYQEKSKGGPWQCVWLPLQPMGFLGLAPGGPVRILFKTKKASNENELNQIFMGGGPLRGMIVNKVESLGSEEKKHLTQGYPGIDFDKCYIFEHERHPAGTTQVVGMMGGGGFLFLIGLAWFTAGWQKNR
ncbi:MAG TPA: hypothetical protein VFT74_20865, partial [Isosphaeraceae bacterium]|nr:hypothetical protein [Isosphaeraceae bacterium]